MYWATHLGNGEGNSSSPEVVGNEIGVESLGGCYHLVIDAIQIMKGPPSCLNTTTLEKVSLLPCSLCIKLLIFAINQKLTMLLWNAGLDG